MWNCAYIGDLYVQHAYLPVVCPDVCSSKVDTGRCVIIQEVLTSLFCPSCVVSVGVGGYAGSGGSKPIETLLPHSHHVVGVNCLHVVSSFLYPRLHPDRHV